MSIDEFLKIVVPKLPLPAQDSYTFMKGSELKLTAVKEVDGNPIEDDKMYRIPVPVFVHSETKQDFHMKKLRLAWLRGGKLAVKTHLLKYLDKEVVEKAITVL